MLVDFNGLQGAISDDRTLHNPSCENFKSFDVKWIYLYFDYSNLRFIHKMNDIYCKWKIEGNSEIQVKKNQNLQIKH
jgi:hypothetical protein